MAVLYPSLCRFSAGSADEAAVLWLCAAASDSVLIEVGAFIPLFSTVSTPLLPQNNVDVILLSPLGVSAFVSVLFADRFAAFGAIVTAVAV